MSIKTTLTKGTIVRPPSPITEVSSTQKVNYIGVIDHILALDPNNRINSNSLLYKLALKQWFSQVKGTTKRVPLPSWFCGFPGPPSVFSGLDGSPSFLQTPPPTTVYGIEPHIYPIVPTFDISLLSIDISSISSTLCADDICLDYGLPGSFGYSYCSGSIVELGVTIDWSSAFYSVLTTVGGTEGEGDGDGGGSGGGSTPTYPPVDPTGKSLTMFLFPSVNVTPSEYANGNTSTLLFFAPKFTDSYKIKTIQYLKSQGCNTILLPLWTDGGNSDFTISPYLNSFMGGAFNEPLLAYWVSWFSKLYDEKMPAIPLLMMADGGQSWTSSSHAAEHNRCIQKLIPLIDPYILYWCVGLESSEWADAGYVNTLAGYFKAAGTTKAVGSHEQSKRLTKTVAPNIDYIAYESWDPNQDNEHSPAECAQWAKDIIASGQNAIAGEYSVNSTSGLARDMGRAAIAAGAVGAWNGF